MQVKCSVDLQCDLIKKVLGVAKGLIPNDSEELSGQRVFSACHWGKHTRL